MMKKLISYTLLVSLAYSGSCNRNNNNDDEARDYISQYNYSDNTNIDIYLDDLEGTMISPLPVPKEGSAFELYATGIGNDDQLYHLDTKVVGTYMPEGEINIVTKDYFSNSRTRADWAFEVSYDYNENVNLPEGGLSAEDAVTTLFVQTGQGYNDEGVFSSADPYTIVSYELSEGSGTEEMSHGLNVDNVIDGYGELVFAMVTQPNDNVPVSSNLDRKTLQVFPQPSADIAGIASGEYLHSLPDFTVSYNNVYPRSTTYVRIQKEEATEGTVIPISVYDLSDRDEINVPQNTSFAIESWAVIEKDSLTTDAQHNEYKVAYEEKGTVYTLKDDNYKIQVVVETPIGMDASGNLVYGDPEILKEISIKVDTTVNIRGSVVTSE